MRAILSLSVAVVLLASAPASATYSIVGADRATRQVGVAGTSCVAPSSVFTIYGSSPGHGAVASQALASTAGRNRAVQRLGMDVAPAEIIAELTGAAFDRMAAQRQYGIVDIMGRAAGHTGTGNSTFADDRQGTVGDFAYSVQGNILTGAAVLTQAATAFTGEGCDLADRLMRALEAGARNGQGDRRCTPAGAPSDSAFVAVDRPGEPAGSYLRLRVEGPRRTDPLPRLRVMFDAWRATHPCSGDAPDAGLPADAAADGPRAMDASRDSAAPVDARVDAAVDLPPRAAPDAAIDAAGGSGGAGGAGSPPPPPAVDASVDSPVAGGEKPGAGCGCDVGGRSGGFSLFWLATLLLVRRRR